MPGVWEEGLMTGKRDFLLEQMRARLEHYREIGIDSVTPRFQSILLRVLSHQSPDAPQAAPPYSSPHTPAPGVKNPPAVMEPLPATMSMFERKLGDTPSNFTLEQVRNDLGDCQRCRLSSARTNIVFGSGNPHAQLVFVGEGPGADEDIQGLPFVGRAGQLLTKMIESIHLKREEVYICNVVKCRPPRNRFPEKDEIAACSPFLARQLEVIQPRIICCLGAAAAQTLLNAKVPISALRGRFREYRGAQLMVTYHPAYLLRNPSAKREVWEDLKKIRAALNLEHRK